ncbi:hypothetical protein [Methylobacterium sp. J-070]|uniref:hypothetical protein n=1 Tax=Methylobacterium sp. J-070 TaxID=2836650 RepID=UPI001FBB26DA|nr:hypothetical protein [Methylobacterium sp. J-070]MCJ2048412.1 hypothetical protein [Methylobacterium sp. J-070]
MKGKVEVIELVPPGVLTALTPGQETRPGYMPLDAFSNETMALLHQKPIPAEVMVERVRPLRLAEAEGRLGQMVTMLHDASRKAAWQNRSLRCRKLRSC